MRHLIHIHKTDPAGRPSAAPGTPLDSMALLVGAGAMVAAMAVSVLAGVLWMLVARG